MSWYQYILPALGLPDVSAANNKQKQGFYDAAQQAGDLGTQQQALQMEGLDRALGFYQPAKDRMRAAYGDPGSVRR
jgi:hypothetical protein